MPPRIWNLRINLDEFNAALGSVFTDEDRALLLQGMGLGFNGGLCSNTVPSPFRTGYAGSSRQDDDLPRLESLGDIIQPSKPRPIPRRNI